MTLKGISENIAQIIEKYLVQKPDDRFQVSGFERMVSSINSFVEKNEKILFLLPGFPFKSPNINEKTFGIMPDMGEYFAIEKIKEFCDEVSSVYPIGVEITILSDGTTFNDIVGVSDDIRDEYNSALRKINSSDYIKWADLNCFFDSILSTDKKRKKLVSQSGLKYKNLEAFIKYIKSNEEETIVHDKLCSYLYNDFKLIKEDGVSNDDYWDIVSHKSYEMMYRGQALSLNIKRTFPNHIRLSTHQYDNAGPKFTFGLTNDSSHAISPWHTVPVLSLDGKVSSLNHRNIDLNKHALVTFSESNWMYIETDNIESTKFTYCIQKKPDFGLVIEDKNNIGFSNLSTHFLSFLVKEFAFICLKGVHFNDEEQFSNFCSPFGKIYHWDFGPVHVVKADEKPDGYVHSLEKVPLHWDLSMLPADHPEVLKDKWFSASEFMLYCKVPPVEGEGQTTIVDSRSMLRIAGKEKLNQWKDISVTYNTKKTYFGGEPRAFPLVHVHPKTGERIIRYQEGSQSSLQEFTLSNKSSMSQEDFSSLVNEINDLAYDPRCMLEHRWQADDLILIDNYRTLHGRLSMTESSRNRELWRVQVTI